MGRKVINEVNECEQRGANETKLSLSFNLWKIINKMNLF